jgi:hypothetical protein
MPFNFKDSASTPSASSKKHVVVASSPQTPSSSISVLFVNQKNATTSVIGQVEIILPIIERGLMTHPRLLNLIRASTTRIVDSTRVSGHVQKSNSKLTSKILPTEWSTDESLSDALVKDYGKEKLYLVVNEAAEIVPEKKRKRKEVVLDERTKIFESLKNKYTESLCSSGAHAGKNLMCVNLRTGGCKVMTNPMLHSWANEIVSIAPD